MGDKFIDPKTGKEVFRIQDNKEIVSDEHKDKWKKEKASVDKPIDKPIEKKDDGDQDGSTDKSN